jgi:hypothetical protein
MSANYDIIAQQGSDFTLYLQYLNENDTPVDLTNCSVRMQVRRSYELDTILGDFSSSPFGATVGLTGSHGGITLNCSINGVTGFTGGILLFVDGTGMSDMPIGRFVYDMKLTNSQKATRLIEGRFDTGPGSVTR